MNRWGFLAADQQGEAQKAQVIERLDQYAQKAPVELNDQPFLGLVRAENFTKVTTMMSGL